MKIAFLDTETTGLHADRRAWEIAIYLREDGKRPRMIEWTVRVDDLDLGNADRQALDIGGFYQRHQEVAFGAGDADVDVTTLAVQPSSEAIVMKHLEAHTRGAHIVGINPHFDLELLAARMRWHDILPSWYYSPDCVKSLSRGYLAARGRPMPPDTRSDDLFLAVGVDPNDFARHTAAGDAALACAVWDRVMPPIHQPVIAAVA